MLAINGEDRKRSHSSTLKSARVLISLAFRPIASRASQMRTRDSDSKGLAHQSPPDLEAIEPAVPCQSNHHEFREKKQPKPTPAPVQTPAETDTITATKGSKS